MIEILSFISRITPNIQLALTTNKMHNETTNNEEFKKAKAVCQYGFKGSHRLCTVRELYNTSLWIGLNAKEVSVPLLLFHGLRDKITTPTASISMFENLKCPDKQIVLLPESDHCLLIPSLDLDLTPNFVCVRILNWLDSLVD